MRCSWPPPTRWRSSSAKRTSIRAASTPRSRASVRFQPASPRRLPKLLTNAVLPPGSRRRTCSPTCSRKCTTRAIERSRKISEAPRDRSRTGAFSADFELAVRNFDQSLRGTNGQLGPNKTPKRTPSNAAQAVIGNVRLSHPDRVYWEDAGVSKRDLAEFYTHIWKWMRPHVHRAPDRAAALPGGRGRTMFLPEACRRHRHRIPASGLRKGRQDHLARRSRRLDLAGAGGRPGNPHARHHQRRPRASPSGGGSDCPPGGALGRADRLVFDLDPGPGTGWSDVVAAAREVRERLERLKLKSFVKTSGGKGLHVVLPIKPTPWDEAKDFEI